MLENLTSEQITEWKAYDEIDPIGEWRADYRMAYLAALYMNVKIQQGTPRNEKPKLQVPSDHMPPYGMTEEEIAESRIKKQSLEELKAGLLEWARVHNESVRQKKKIRTRPPVSMQKKKGKKRPPNKKRRKK